MSHPKVKEERYANVKGINTKVSVYSTDDGAVLELENYDFQQPGAWTKRWGYTSAAANATLSLGGRPVLDMITSFNNTYGLQNLVFTDSAPYIYTFDATKSGYPAGMTNGMFNQVTKGSTPIYSGATPAQTVCSRNFNFMSFWTTGATIYKFSADTLSVGSTFRVGVFSLPQPPAQVPPGISFGSFGTGGGFSGPYVYNFGYRDIFGQIVPGVRPFDGSFGPVYAPGTHSQVAPVGASFAGFSFAPTAGATLITLANLPVPTGDDYYAIRSLVVYRNKVSGYPSSDFVSVGEISAGGTTTFFDTPAGGNGSLVGYPIPTHTQFTFTGVPQGANPDILTPYSTLPNYLEVYSNRLWIGTKRNNTIYFSELLAPEVIEPENNFGVNTSETDLTGLKAFNQTLIVALRKGIWRLTGDNPQNFNFLELTKEYGVVSNKSMLVWNEKLWFLDQGQIVEFNGSNFNSVSNAIQALLSTVDYSAAEEKASSMHLPERNEVWFSVPVNGSTFNTVIVYDYLVQAFTTFKGIPATSLAQLWTEDTVSGTSTFFAERNPKYFFGSQGGTLNYFDTTFKTDSGAGITCAFRTKYHQPIPRTSTSQFRRFYVDNGPLTTGQTLTYALEFYADYATLAPSATMTLVSTKFQKRKEFGIPAKSLSVRVTHVSGDQDHKLYGYTVESRFQRNV